jgi:hypothetical protein
MLTEPERRGVPILGRRTPQPTRAPGSPAAPPTPTAYGPSTRQAPPPRPTRPPERPPPALEPTPSITRARPPHPASPVIRPARRPARAGGCRSMPDPQCAPASATSCTVCASQSILSTTRRPFPGPRSTSAGPRSARCNDAEPVRWGAGAGTAMNAGIWARAPARGPADRLRPLALQLILCLNIAKKSDLSIKTSRVLIRGPRRRFSDRAVRRLLAQLKPKDSL